MTESAYEVLTINAYILCRIRYFYTKWKVCSFWKRLVEIILQILPALISSIVVSMFLNFATFIMHICIEIAPSIWQPDMNTHFDFYVFASRLTPY